MRISVDYLVTVLRAANRRRLQRRRAQCGSDYQRWVHLYDSLTPRLNAALADRLEALRASPTIALVMLAQESDHRGLKTALDSVKKQIYPRWELCIAVDPRLAVAPRRRLAAAAARDKRITLVECDTSVDEATALCRALKRVSAQHVGILGHGGALARHALLLVAEAMERHPRGEVFYSDEDELNAKGERCNPHFKSAWNPELLFCLPYLRHLTTYRTELLHCSGVLAQAFAGDTDVFCHRLALRCTEALDAAGVIHIPHILYHAHSRAVGEKAAAASAEAGAQAVRDQLQRLGLNACVDPDPMGGYQLRFAPPSPPPLVSIIIPTRDRLDLLQPCVDSVLAKTRYAAFEMIVVDNGSEHPQTLHYLERLAAHDRVRVLRDERPFNYAELNNLAVEQAKGEFIVLLNNDTEVISPGWLGEMLGLAALPGIGAVGARLWYDDMSLQHAGVILGLGGVAGHAHRLLPRGTPGYRGRAHLLQGFSAVTAACLLVRKSAYLAVGGLDKDAFAVAYNDVDFCLRLRAVGYRNVWTPNAELFHHESKSRGDDLSDEHIDRYRREVATMLERWGPMLKNDPAYNPNLSLSDAAFGLAWPPRTSLSRPWFDEECRTPMPRASRRGTDAPASPARQSLAEQASRP